MDLRGPTSKGRDWRGREGKERGRSERSGRKRMGVEWKVCCIGFGRRKHVASTRSLLYILPYISAD